MHIAKNFIARIALFLALFFVLCPVIYAQQRCAEEVCVRGRCELIPRPDYPGCSSPDDNYSVSTLLPDQLGYQTQYPDVVTLLQGYHENFSLLAGRMKKGETFTNIQSFAGDVLGSSRLMVIPSGGLFAVENSQIFKALLDEYVKQGGTLLVFSQQQGRALSILPVSQEADGTYKQVVGYGWNEDQNCFADSVYIDTWHQMLAGQSRSTPSVNVDGYFTSYPSNAVVLLRRTANGQPALLMYDYGQGKVIVTSMYSDVAYTLGQWSMEEKALIRDIVSWVKAPAQLPQVMPGEAVSVSVSVVNDTIVDAASVILTVLDPDRNVLETQTVGTPVPAGQAIVIPTSYATTTASPLGIWSVDYALTDALGNIIKTQSNTDSGRFVVSNPLSNPYKSPDFNFSVNTVAEYFSYYSDVLFTVHAWNNNTTIDKTITARYVFPQHYRRTRDASYGVYKGSYAPGSDDQWLATTMTVGASMTASFDYLMKKAVQDDLIYINFYDENNKYLGSSNRGFSIFNIWANVSARSDRYWYTKGETATLTLSIRTNQNAISSVGTGSLFKLQTTVVDPSNTPIYSNVLDINLIGGVTNIQTERFTFPSNARGGSYAVKSEVYDSSDRKIGATWINFYMPSIYDVKITPIIPTIWQPSANTLSFVFINNGNVDVSSEVLEISLKDPDGTSVYAGTQSFGLRFGETKTVDIPISISPLKVGNYVLTYTASNESGRGYPAYTNIPNTSLVNITTDRPIYKIGETASISITVKNTGKFMQEGILTTTVPALGLTDTRTIVLNPSESASVPYSIPLPVTLNSGIEVNASFALYGGQIQRSLSISILPVTLDQTINFDKPSYRIRETVGMNYVLTNNGNFASPLNATLSVSIPDIGYTHDGPLVIEPGKKIEIPLSVAIPETLGAGQHQVLTSVTLPSGAVHNRVFTFTVPEVAFKIKMPEVAAFKIGDTVTVSVENVGGLDADSNYYVDLSGIGQSIHWDSINDGIQAGANKSYIFQIPSQAGSGEYILYAGAYDAKTGIWDDSSKTINITGLNSSLFVKTDKDIYLSTEDITTLGQIANGPYPIDNGNLHLQIVNNCDGSGGGGGGIPASFYFSTWNGEGWTEQGLLHYPNTFQTQSIWLSGYYVPEDEDCRVKIRHEGTGNAEIDKILLLSGEASLAPNSAFNTTTSEDITGLVHYQDSEAASVLNNEIYVRWICDTWMDDKVILMVAKEGSVSCQKKIYWQTDIPITQASDTTVDLNRLVNALYLTGQFYLQGTLSSSTGQIIAESEYPFSIIDGDIGLTLKTDKAIYKPGETVTITGAVVNLSDIEASGIALEISTGANTLYTRTFNIVAKGSSAFSFTTTASAEGVYQLLGSLSQSGNPLYSMGTTYEVSPPLIDPYLYGPEIVGSAPFTLNFEAYNAGKVPVTIQAAVTGGSLSDTQEITIPVNGSKLLQYSQQITGDTTYTVTITGDVSQILEYTAVFGEKAELQISAQPAYRVGEITIPYLIKNIGTLEAAYPVNCIVTKDGQEVLRTSASFVLPVNGSDSRKINLNLAEGLYVLTCETTGAQAQAQLNVVKTGQLQIALNTNQIYSEGPMTAASVITNTGLLDEIITVTYTLQPTAQVQTKSYYIAKGGSISDSLNYDLTEGTYQLTAASLEPVLTTVANFEVRKDSNVSMALSTGEQLNSLIPATVTLTNLGFNSIDGSVYLSLVNSLGASIWNSSQEVSLPFMAVPTPNSINFNINPAAITPGDYIVKAEFFNSNNQSLIVSTQPLTIKTATIQITQLPPYQTFSAGQNATLTFKLKNSGNQEGFAELTLKAYDLANLLEGQWLLPGEERDVTFSFVLPADLEERDYFADYEFKGQGAIALGQVKYHLAGTNITVNSSLDKQTYRDNDTARLTLDVRNQTAEAGATNLFARVNYSGYVQLVPFTLNGSQTLSVDVPLGQITGEKLSYGIYHQSGRGIHLNALYINQAGDALTITTDKQVYNPGETVSVRIDGQGANINGMMTLTGVNYTETFAFSGSTTKGFALPAFMIAGTYNVSYQITDAIGQTYSGSQPFDVKGIQVQIFDAILDKSKYTETDTITANLTITSNRDIAGTLKTWILDPEENSVYIGQQPIALSSTVPIKVTNSSPFATNISGIHRLLFGVYANDTLLASGAKAFDVGDAMLLGLATDKAEYVENTDPVTAKVRMYGAADANLEFQLNGISIKTEPVVLNGFATLNSALGTVPVGRHVIKAVLTSGGLTSTKETNFTVRQADIIPPATTITVGDPQYTAADGNHYVTSATVFTLLATDNLSGVSKTEYRVDGGAWNPSASFSISIAGSHLIEYSSQDNAGNAEDIKSLTVIVDTSPPTGSIVINNSTAYTNNTSVTLTLICTDSASGCIQMQFSNDSTTWSTPEAYATTKAWLLASGDGPKTVYVKYNDGVGNPSTAYSAGITLDTIPPVTTATPAGGIYNAAQSVTLAANKAATIYYTTNGTIPTTGSPVYGGPITIAETTTLLFFAVDSAGNSEAITSTTYTIDTEAPVLSLSTLPDGSYTNNTTLNISGTVTDDNEVQGVSINDTAVPINADGTFSQAITLITGPNTITIVAKDKAENTTTDQRTIILDQMAPNLLILTPADNSITNLADVIVMGAVDETSIVIVKVNDGSPISATMTGTNFSAEVTLTYGQNTIEVTATDLANNTITGKRTVTFDNLSPALAVTIPPQDITTNESNVLLQGTVSDLTALTVTVMVDGIEYTPAVTAGMFEQQLTFIDEKTSAVIVTAVDGAGNTSTVQRNIIYQLPPSGQTTISYTGPMFIAQGRPVTLSGVLKVDGTTPPNPFWQTISFTLGTGSSSQSCTGTTDADGKASCTISSVTAPVGPTTVTAIFAGDSLYQPSSDSKSVTVFAYPATGAFVIGDMNAAINSAVTFWGSRWRTDNSLSNGPAPASFKGFGDVANTTSLVCGGTWLSSPGNSSNPPNSIPAYMAVLVSSSISKSGNRISGNVPAIAIVQTNPGYAPNPGHAGTGTVIGVLCHQ